MMRHISYCSNVPTATSKFRNTFSFVCSNVFDGASPVLKRRARPVGHAAMKAEATSTFVHEEPASHVPGQYAPNR